MARDGRIVIETIRDIVNSANITHVLAIAEKATYRLPPSRHPPTHTVSPSPHCSGPFIYTTEARPLPQACFSLVSRFISHGIRGFLCVCACACVCVCTCRPLALPAGENDDGVRQRGRGAALPAPPPADPEITLRSLHEVKGITDNVHNIIDSQNTSKLFDTLVFMQNPRTMYTALQVSVLFDACVPCIQSDRWPTSGSPTYALARRPVQSRRC
jgi:hypothetical protein